MGPKDKRLACPNPSEGENVFDAAEVIVLGRAGDRKGREERATPLGELASKKALGNWRHYQLGKTPRRKKNRSD